jgi:hypothetical protein
MMLHPGVIALLTGSTFVVLLMLYSAFLGIRILGRWDMQSSSAEQLSLERRTYLISTIMNYVLGFVILSSILFIYTVDDLHSAFIGAMCATGSLNANPVGWVSLFTKILLIFVSAAWICLNHMDQQVEDYPLVKINYSLLLLITPLVLTDAWLQIRYFVGLRADVITSCCGALFTEEGGGIAGDLSGLPVKPMMTAFYLAVAAFLLNAVLSLRFSILHYASIPLSLFLFAVSLASMVSFISLYFYKIPTHHCPFCLLQKEYLFIGYPVYLTLFSGVFFGMLSGISEVLKKKPSLAVYIHTCQKRWTLASICFTTLFFIICSWPVVFGPLTLEGYYF